MAWLADCRRGAAAILIGGGALPGRGLCCWWQVGGYPIRFRPCRRGDPLPIGAAVGPIVGVVLVHLAGGGVLAGLAVGGGGAALSYMVAMGMPRCCRRWRGFAGAGLVLLVGRSGLSYKVWAMPPGVHRGGSTVPGATVPAGAVPGWEALS